MYRNLLTRAWSTVLLAAICSSANATFHLWAISEIYSNADGSVQFVELATSFGNQQFITGHAITSTQGATTRSFTFPSDLAGDSTNKTFLIGTAGFAALGVVTPDYVVPNGFLFTSNGVVNFAGVDSVSYAALPTDGIFSIDRNGVPGVNSPRNFAGATGTIVPPPPPPPPPPVPPGAPTIDSAVPGSGQATISFTPPASTGGSPITSYTVTCNPGAIAASAAASPITVTGLTNGTPYSCSVVATNVAGSGPPSSAASVTPAAVVTSVSGASPTGTGTITATFTGGGAACSFTSAQFIAGEGDAGSPPAGSAPARIAFPHGLFAFTAGGCVAGSTITMVVTYPTALPATTQYWKYGPTAAQPAAHWYILPAAIGANTATFTIADGGLGDDDLAANGTIVDQGGPGVPGPAAQVPSLSEWAMLLLAAMLAASGLVAAQGRGSRRRPRG